MNPDRRDGSAPARRPANPIPPIGYPESLPVSARRGEILRALADHPVIVVCGETGSGKTTQLPKIALELGRGPGAGGRGLIGHTQPRRIAAASVAKRIAEELNSPLGAVVGYKVRFQDRFQAGASVKLMTDGILLAETRSDPELRAYDTLIIDEAHERSLNIDFLLGYLKQLLPRRPDLKVIVTSATIDAERFANHFASIGGPAPVIQVSGRLYPVEQRWRPFEETRDFDLNDAIAQAVDELWLSTGDGGDVLVFLPGEREIREAADHLQRHLAKAHRVRPTADIVPLFARLSQAEQERVFEPHSSRRVVLATNVAETSLTVPGIRYVIDSGLARVKRYSYRHKVEQLQIEPISQAAANQRAGRCGRVADGICIRLYDEKSFAERAPYTDPEILRSSLAGVILRMKSLGLGVVEGFPFLEPPPRKAIADGYALLSELGAVDEGNELTAIGNELSQLPLDPRVGRMILAARDRQSLAEVLIIASALSAQDVRDRPLEHAQLADERHKPFDDEKSEFVGYLKLWQWIEQGRGIHGHAAQRTDSHKLSNRQQEQRLRDHFVSPRRVREWRDIHTQLHTVVAEHGWRLNASPATYEQIHMAMLAGLLGNVGCRAAAAEPPQGGTVPTRAGEGRHGRVDEDWYLGARGIKFWRHPGAHLSKKPGRWLIAAELVETTRLYGRGLAAIDPQWIAAIAGHLLKTQLLEPHWEKKCGEVVALERASLYGIVVYNDRRVNFGHVDPAAARALFIRHALVEGDWDSKMEFLAHNRKLVAQVQELEHKSRRQDVLVDDSLIHAFYEQQIPADVNTGAGLERWYREEVKRQPQLLRLTRDELMRHEAAGITTAAFPKVVRLGGIDSAATYLHQPGDARDGLTVTVPIYALNQISDERCEWLVPGLLKEKVIALLKTLPGKPRARLLPLPEWADGFVARTDFADGSLIDRLQAAVRSHTGLEVKRADFKTDTLGAHLFMNLRVVDEDGRQLGMGRHVAALKAELGSRARNAFQALANLKRPVAAAESGAAPTAAPPGAGPLAQQRYAEWTFGELPELMELRSGNQTLVGFPALVDKNTHVELEVFDEPEAASEKHRAGLRRLVALAMRDALKALERNIADLQRMAVLYTQVERASEGSGGGGADELRDQIVAVALDRAFLAEPLPTDSVSFKRRVDEGRSRLNLIAQEVARLTAGVLDEFANATRKLKDSRPPKDVAEDISAQLQRLCPKRFIVLTPYVQLQHLPRYLKAVTLRLDKLRTDPARDAQRLGELRPLEQRYVRRLAELKGARDARLEEYRWLLEELRVSLFAQELRTPQPVSVKRLERAWQQLSS